MHIINKFRDFLKGILQLSREIKEHFRAVLMVGSIFGIIAFGWSAYLHRELASNLPYVACLIVAVTVTVYTGWLAVRAILRFNLRRRERAVTLWSWLGLGFALLSPLLALSFFMSWGFPGSWMRSWPFLEFIPEGNMFDGAGYSGLTYLAFYCIFIVAASWNAMKSRYKKVKSLRRVMQADQSPKFSQPAEDARPASTGHTSGEADMHDLFGTQPHPQYGQ